MIDLHTHILPGIDDGAATLAESRAIAERAVVDGITAVAATPHVRDDYPTTPAEMESRVATLREDFAQKGIPLEVHFGGELDLGALGGLTPDDLRRFSLAQTGRYVLVEFPYRGWPLGLERIAFELRAAGLTCLLAHPERNPEVKAAPERLEPLVRSGTLVQVTAASLDGRLGRATQQAAKRLFELRLAHVLASDAHSPALREMGLADAVATLDDHGLATFLTEDAPAAILAGAELDPPPPATGPRRKRFGLF